MGAALGVALAAGKTATALTEALVNGPVATFASRLDGTPVDERPRQGTGAAQNDVLIAFDTEGAQSVVAQVTQNASGTYLIFEGSMDPANGPWVPLPQTAPIRAGIPTVFASIPTTTGITLACETLGFPSVRLKIETAGSGPVTAVGRAIQRPLSRMLADTLTKCAVLTNVSRLVLQNSPALLAGYDVRNNNAAVRYLQFFDTTAIPGGGSTPTRSVPIGPSESARIQGLRVQHKSGIAWAVSTDPYTLALGAAGDLVGSVDFKG